MTTPKPPQSLSDPRAAEWCAQVARSLVTAATPARQKRILEGRQVTEAPFEVWSAMWDILPVDDDSKTMHARHMSALWAQGRGGEIVDHVRARPGTLDMTLRAMSFIQEPHKADMMFSVLATQPATIPLDPPVARVVWIAMVGQNNPPADVMANAWSCMTDDMRSRVVHAAILGGHDAAQWLGQIPPSQRKWPDICRCMLGALAAGRPCDVAAYMSLAPPALFSSEIFPNLISGCARPCEPLVPYYTSTLDPKGLAVSAAIKREDHSLLRVLLLKHAVLPPDMVMKDVLHDLVERVGATRHAAVHPEHLRMMGVLLDVCSSADISAVMGAITTQTDGSYLSTTMSEGAKITAPLLFGKMDDEDKERFIQSVSHALDVPAVRAFVEKRAMAQATEDATRLPRPAIKM